MSAEYCGAVDACILNTEKDGSILFSWEVSLWWFQDLCYSCSVFSLQSSTIQVILVLRVAVLVLHLFSVTLHHKRCRMYRCVCILVQDFIFNTRPEDKLTMPSYIVIEMPLNKTVYSISPHLEFCSHIWFTFWEMSVYVFLESQMRCCLVKPLNGAYIFNDGGATVSVGLGG